jgi:DMSO/TMAO reductase YedYZ heme-binding membrane subunit
MPILNTLFPKLPMSLTRELGFYLKTSIFGLIVFAMCYGYLRWMNIPGELNKSVADTSILLMGLSMVLSSVCYFWNFLDWAIVYRKYLGLIGFAFGLAHVVLSWNVLLSLMQATTWEQGKMWPALAGTVALLIFTVMALISNSFSARLLGGKNWRYILRTGYLAVILVSFHVVLLKSARWVTWYQGGMKTPPSLSLIVTIFMAVVVIMRLLLWLRLSRVSAKLGK